jgi:hypothetical protein
MQIPQVPDSEVARRCSASGQLFEQTFFYKIFLNAYLI